MARNRAKGPMDSVDAEHVRDMIQTRGWQLYQQRMEETLRRKVADLAHDQTETATAKLRGEIAAFVLALGVPAILIKEAKERK